MSTFAELYGDAIAYSHSKNTAAAKRFVNAGLVDLVARCKLNLKVSTEVLVPGQVSYTFASFGITDMLGIIGIQSGASMDIIAPTSINDVLAYNAGNPDGGGLWEGYAMLGTTGIVIYPKPTSAVSFDIYYTATPVVLVADGDVPAEVPTHFHDALAEFGAWQLAKREDARLAETFHQGYQARVADLNAFLHGRAGSAPQITQVGYPGRQRSVPSSRGVDVR